MWCWIRLLDGGGEAVPGPTRRLTACTPSTVTAPTQVPSGPGEGRASPHSGTRGGPRLAPLGPRRSRRLGQQGRRGGVQAPGHEWAGGARAGPQMRGALLGGDRVLPRECLHQL